MTTRNKRKVSNIEKRREQIRLAVRRSVAAGDVIAIDSYRISDRRRACENDFIMFCIEYLPQRFPLPDSADQIEIKRKLQHAALTGGLFAQSAPRGDGKTQRAVAGVLWAWLYGHRRYVLAVGATGQFGKRLVQDVSQELVDNDRLAQDWPEICKPIREAWSKPNRAKYLTVSVDGGEHIDPRLTVTTMKVVAPTVPGACLDEMRAIAGNVVEGAGITAAFRGIRHTTANGETLRPDLAVLDDIQTRKSAKSHSQTESTMAILRGDIRRLGGPDRELACVCNCTVIRKGDAADQLLDNKENPQWRGVRKKMVYEWPKRVDLWDIYQTKRREGLLEGDGGASANAYYAEHRAEMDAGAVVGWAERYRRDIGEVSAIQCAYNILCDDGEESFAAECQNEPLSVRSTQYELTPEIITSRVSGHERLNAPHGAEYIIAAADLNYIGLNWQLLAARKDMAAWSVDYGKHPRDTWLIDKQRSSGMTEAQAVTRGIIELANHINGISVMVAGVARYPDCLFIDCGFMTDTVLTAISSIRLPMRVFAVRGRDAKHYSHGKTALKVGDNWNLQDWKLGRVLVVNVDHWREQMQRAFLLPPGTPGAIGLHGTQPKVHRILAEQICGERLVERVRTNTAEYYNWTRQPGVPNDQPDALTYAYAGLSYAGATVQNAEAAWRPSEKPIAQRPRTSQPARRPSQSPPAWML